MSVLDTFYIQFRTDAKAAADEVKKLDKEIAELAAKGSKRTEAESKQLKELRGLRREATQDFKDQTQATDKLGESLVGIGIKAVAAFASFEAVKKVAGDTIDLNLNLQRTRALTGQNAEEIQAWDQAFTNLGATGGEFTQWFVNASQALQRTGQDTKNLLPWVKSLADEIKSLPEPEARFRFAQASASISDLGGLPADLFQPLREGGKALDEYIAKNRELIKSTKETEDAALGFKAAWLNAWNALLGAVSGSKAFKEIVWALTIVGNSLASLLSGNASGALKILASPLPGGSAASSGSSVSANSPLGIRSNNPGNLQPGGREAVFPTLQAGILAEQSQLKRYGARGINTLAGIAAHWPDRAHQASWLEAVRNKTGYDVNQPLDLNNPSVLSRVAVGINVAEGDAAANVALTGQGAISQADQSPLNSLGGGRSTSVSIGTVTVNTQATDAHNIAAAIAGALSGQISAVISNHDDGIVK